MFKVIYIENYYVLDILYAQTSQIYFFYSYQITLKKTFNCLGIIVLPYPHRASKNPQGDRYKLVMLYTLLFVLIIYSDGFDGTTAFLYPDYNSEYCLKKRSYFIYGAVANSLCNDWTITLVILQAVPIIITIISNLTNLCIMEEILVNPMSLVAMTTYHSKNCPQNIGVSYGLLYALQEELSYKITLTAPLGTNQNSASEIVERMVQYQTLRLRKGKDNMNYYEQFILIGWYAMGAKKTIDEKAVSELNKSFEERGSLYSLIYIVDRQADSDPQLFKLSKPIKFKFAIDPLQKYCADALSMQNSNKQSAIAKTLNKQLHLLEIYNEKLQKLTHLLENTKSQDKKRQILQVIQQYERIQYGNKQQKEKTVKAINYSVLTGMILTYSNEEK